MSLEITKSAAHRIIELLQQENCYALRISIVGGGCSGFSYNYELTNSKNDNDNLFEFEGAKVVIDNVSLPLLLGAKLDYRDNIIEQSFFIDNPNAVSSCGCGVSFSI